MSGRRGETALRQVSAEEDIGVSDCELSAEEVREDEYVDIEWGWINLSNYEAEVDFTLRVGTNDVWDGKTTVAAGADGTISRSNSSFIPEEVGIPPGEDYPIEIVIHDAVAV